MQVDAFAQANGLEYENQFDTAVVNYINEIISRYEEEKTNYEQQIQNLHKKINDLLDYQNKYLDIKEKYDLLVYKRFMRSAEQIHYDSNQPFLFSGEAEPEAPPAKDEKTETEETETITYIRKKRGRKPIDPAIPRIERILDIPEEEKKCACGADLTRIGE